MISVFLLAAAFNCYADTPLTRVMPLKVGEVDKHTAVLLPTDSETQTHVIQKAGIYSIYFRNAVIFHGGEKYRIERDGFESANVKQMKPGVVVMELIHSGDYEITGGSYDSKRGGYIFYTKKVDKPQKPAEKSILEIEAEREIRQYREKLAGRKAGSRIRRVVIDPGHGGFDPGAVGKGGLKEKDVVLDIAKRVNRIINDETTIQSFLTRRDDYYIPLSSRTVIANKYRADLFVSIHANASENRSARGFEVYYCSEKASSKEASEVARRENISFEEESYSRAESGMVNIEEIVFKAGRGKLWEDSRYTCDRMISLFPSDVGVKVRGSQSANFFVLRKAKMPSVLVEVAFISNYEEEEFLGKEKSREKMAREIAKILKNLSLD
ncbi:MAG: N-acetylmuramoyl-L-alanine amidase [Candidatus Krumholzibacteriota bacterium]|nr:N-acetylmuramoyl-L-alanine amidase [Candidatus Krumholzibacteriota bacterium]